MPWRVMALTGHLGLILLLMVWEIWLDPFGVLPRSLVIVLMVGPLLIPLRGILHGRPYTHAWTSFLSLFYFLHGVGAAYAGEQFAYLGWLEVLFSLMLFVGAIFFTRYRNREIKQLADG
ncbi:MAG: DUF2069 domain-containing protein [Gammaproteobacteria bacterium]|nr:DUF2069 domain-containing protein [Gammaproteobacteria bacterium]